MDSQLIVEKQRVKLTQEVIDEKYGGQIQIEQSGPLYKVFGNLIKPIAGIDKIIVPSDFQSARDGKVAIPCQVKVQDGYLYPLKSSLVWVQKPILYIKHKEIKYVEFQRIGEQASGTTSKTFDIQVVKFEQDGGNEQFKNLDKCEYKALY